MVRPMPAVLGLVSQIFDQACQIKYCTRICLQVATAFTRRKAVANERKQKKEQKDEAERYVAKQKELVSTLFRQSLCFACIAPI